MAETKTETKPEEAISMANLTEEEAISVANLTEGTDHQSKRNSPEIQGSDPGNDANTALLSRDVEKDTDGGEKSPPGSRAKSEEAIEIEATEAKQGEG